jgi:hypothetical protein
MTKQNVAFSPSQAWLLIWLHAWARRKIRLLEGNAKCRHLEKLTYKGTLRQMFICLRPPPLLRFCLGWSRNFVGSESSLVYW